MTTAKEIAKDNPTSKGLEEHPKVKYQKAKEAAAKKKKKAAKIGVK